MEIVVIEKAALEDEGVKAELAKLKLPEGTVVISDPWIYGKDSCRYSIIIFLTQLARFGWRK